MKTFTIAYRTGGPARFQWLRTFAYPTYEAAELAAGEIRRGGRKAIVFLTSRLDAIGLPEGWDADDLKYWHDRVPQEDVDRFAVAGNRDPNS